ncbi:hypothetical protein EON82_06595 [bacterium]|nr:MAG: hypothetical protein EON82_06595 [bacterium]
MRPLIIVTFLATASFAPGEGLWKVARDHEEAFRKSLLTKDLTWLEKVTAKGFYGEEVDGTRTSRAKTLSSLRDYLTRRTFLKIEPTILTVVRKAGGVLVRVSTSLTGEGMPIWPIKVRRTSTTLHEEFWLREKVGWKLHWIRQLKP